MSMKVSVVICTYTFERYIDAKEAVESISEQSYHNVEVVLIIDQNVELFHKFEREFENKNVKIGLSTLHGLSNARNKGIELSSGDIIAFIDDDAIADVYWVTNLVKNYENQDIIGTGGKMKPLWISGKVNWIPEEFYWAMGCSYRSQKNEKHYARNTFGSNMSFRSSVFKQVGGFDENFGIIGNIMRTGEETEFSIRATSSIENSKIIYDPEVVVFHKIFDFRRSISFLLKRCYSYGHAMGKINTKIGSENVVENSFLKYLITKSYVSRIEDIIKMKNVRINILQVFALTIFTACVGIGYMNKKYQ